MYPPDFYLTVNTSCYLNSTYNVNATYCQTMRNVTDKECFMAACFVRVNNVNPTPGRITTLFYEYPRTSAIVFSGTNETDDSGPVHTLDVFSKFMTDNIPDSIDPIEPPPEPFNFGVTELFLNATNYGDDYQVSSRELARQTSALIVGAQLSSFYINNSTDLGQELSESSSTIVANARTLRCDNAPLAAIEWLNTNVTLVELLNLVGLMSALNVSNSQCDPSNWPTECLFLTGNTHYCSQFGASGTYYTFTSLRNFTELPSPWRDMTTIATALNNEYALCGEPAGCFGMIA